DDIEQDVLLHHRRAFDPLTLDTSGELLSNGIHKMRSGEEEHLYNPKTISLLQQAVRTGNYDLYQEYAQSVNEEQMSHLRSLFTFKYCENGGIDINEVEDEREIVKRFSSGPMSYGALSEEAHETLAIAMNNLGAKNNTGEGGEDEKRYAASKDGKNRNSAIKQVASARFGVTGKYLVSAKEIQIKIAQGAKPGEGGHLPGSKVYPWIAKTRHSTPGVGLISPPPHHDIYSIEDLAQLIYDLKCANRAADICVKLVSEGGVGTIAAGVAKAGVQQITLSVYDGGTGSAPKTSICNAGLPWELGLAETHQTLILNGLRNRVKLEADSKMMSGRDLAIAAMLGAEQFSFATGPLVALGCVMMRVCNLDTCPMGIATQNPELRKRFKGKPEYVENFMLFMARNLREYMAKLGVRTVAELVGRSDLLLARNDIANERAKKIDLTRIMCNPLIENSCVHFEKDAEFDFELSSTPDIGVLIPSFADVFDKARAKTVSVPIKNTDRSFGTIFGSDITKKYGNTLADDIFTVKSTGSAGQSYGAFIPKGLTLELEGDCNDYVGKGLCGGRIIVYPPRTAEFERDKNIIIGNVALYGATSGKAFISGVAGERFCVRNSGATAVVEGVGDHGCEYMTGGIVAVLGTTGKNFAAGMSGGIAYVFDEHSDLYQRTNKEMVSLEMLERKHDIALLKSLIEEHIAKTKSPLGTKILNDFDFYVPKFKKVLPHDYNTMLKYIAQKEEEGLDKEQAQIEAFYELQKTKA
ncbi:MAG: glutamate synthase-related protein, partial [Spirochaetales bacterium]